MKKWLLVAFAFSVSCTHSGKKNEERVQTMVDSPPQNNEHIVMLVSTGFDPEHEAYKNQILEKYSIICKTEGSEDKKSSLRDLSVQLRSNAKTLLFGDKCEIYKGIFAYNHNNENQEHKQYLSQWNASLRANTYPQHFDEMSKNLEIETLKSEGTTLASILTYKNPNVGIILVDTRNRGIYFSSQCDEIQKNYEEGLKILKDKNVENQLLEKADLSEWKILDTFAKRHRVTLLVKPNSLSKGDLKKHLLVDKKCSRSVYKAAKMFYTERSYIIEKIAKRLGIFYDQEPFLTIQSAGDEATRIDSKKEFFDCSPSDNHIVVGACDSHSRKLFENTNYGKCVDFYAPGTHVIVNTPSNFLFWKDGSDFATALVARYITKEFMPRVKVTEVQKELNKRLNNERFLPFDSFEDQIFKGRRIE